MILITVIISHYKKVENLNLILNGLARQSEKEFEVIVSEDGDDDATRKLLAEKDGTWGFHLVHLTQEDKGFRKNRMLNKSIRNSNGEFLVFIDGDCIPHKHFIKEYRKVMSESAIFYGRRVMMSEKLSSSIIEKGEFTGVKLSDLLFSGSDKIKDHIYSPNFELSTRKQRGLKGCNWGVKKEDILAVNGFDEDYERATTGEDDDISWRLRMSGLKLRSMKNKAIVYHLYHPRGYGTEDSSINLEIMRKKVADGRFYCLNGLEKVDNSTDSES